jgi:hypothetical protein
VIPWVFSIIFSRSRRLLLLLLLSLCLEPRARAEEVGYSLDGAVLLFWQVGITADDGVTSVTDTHTFFCCAETDAVVFGDAVGIVDPTFTPGALTHLLRPAPVAGRVGVHPITLDLAGSLTWSPPSGPSLMTGRSGPMETGPLTAAGFSGTLTTPFGDVPISHALPDHVGGDTSLRRFSGGIDLGPPRLRTSDISEPLDSLEIDESDVAGRVEMRNPYQAVLAEVSAVRDAGSVSYPLASAAGLFWEITITADDGVQPPSSDTFFALAGAAATVEGSISGIVGPVFTPESIVHSIDTTGIELQVGAHPVTLDLSGSLTWTPPAGPSLASGQAAPMPTGDATGASFHGTLTTPIGSVPFTTDLPAHRGGDMTLTRLAAATDLGPPRLRLSTFVDPLDRLEIDEADQAGRVEMRNPYEVILGTTGAVTWSLSARAFFNDAFHSLLPSAPNGAVRNVTWSLHSELFFNDVFYTYDPVLTAPPPRVPVLGGLGRVLLGALLLAGGLASRRARAI